MTYHTQAYHSLTASQQSSVEVVIISTSCTEKIAIDTLISEEWDISDAVIDIMHTYSWAQHKAISYN